MTRTGLRQVLIVLAWGLVFVLLLLAVPRAEAIFNDFGAPLPRITTLVVRASRLGWVWIPLALFPLVVDWFVLGSFQGDEATPASKIWSIFVFALPLALIGAVLVALALPFLTLMTPLSG
jgi:type II secretory pathway component PulF